MKKMIGTLLLLIATAIASYFLGWKTGLDSCRRTSTTIDPSQLSNDLNSVLTSDLAITPKSAKHCGPYYAIPYYDLKEERMSVTAADLPRLLVERDAYPSQYKIVEVVGEFEIEQEITRGPAKVEKVKLPECDDGTGD